MKFLEYLSQGMYMLTMICCVLITILFVQSKNGNLRKCLILFFTTLCWALFARMSVIMGYADIAHIFVISPLCLSTIILTLYLHKTYKQ